MKKVFILVIAVLFFQNTVVSQDAFVTTWQTTEANESITIPTTGAGYDYTINWGDGIIEINQTGDATHVFATVGVQTISISGNFPRIYFNNEGDKDKILTIEQWGNIAWTSMENAFYGCTNLNITNTTIDVPDLSLVTNMEFMLASTSAFNQDISDWDVSNVTSMSAMFLRAEAFNQDISDWDVSNVIDMSTMFFEAIVFNQPLNWTDTSKVIDMNGMFFNATEFNQDISSWNVSKVTNMFRMFREAKTFNQNLSNWDVSSVTSMSYMFYNASSFDEPLNWTNTSSLTNTSYMFAFSNSFNQDISIWDVSNVTDMSNMFWRATAFNQNLSDWDVSNVTDMSQMFHGATIFNQPLNWTNTSNLTDTSAMFFEARVFNQDISSWNVSKVTNMQGMFQFASLFNQPLNWTNTSSLTNTSSMFNTSSAFNQDISSWDVSKVTNMGSMFSGVTLSVINYDNLLKEWSSQTLQSGVVFNGGNSEYCTGELARQSLENIGWSITDGGKSDTNTALLDVINDVSETGNYTLPTITGSGLSGYEMYYTQTGGTGTAYKAGDIVSYTDFETYPSTLYAYDSGSCASAEESFKISITPISSIVITAIAKTKEYGTTDPDLTYTITSGSLEGTDVLTGNLTRISGENVGDYTISQGSLGNAKYDITFETANFSITPIEITVTADDITKEYGTTDPALTYTITSGSLVGTDVLTGSLTRDPDENVDNYSITQGSLDNANYTITFETANFSIIPKEITVSADEITKEYGTTDPTLTYTITSGSLVGTDVLTGSLTRTTGENIGDYNISQGSLDNANYTITFETANFSITPKEITVSADEISKEYRTTDPTLTYTITSGSLVGTDVLTGNLTRVSGEDVGDYTINQGSLGNAKYDITFEAANFSITPIEITVTADDITKEYGTADPDLTYTTSGSLVGTDVLTGSLTRDSGENVDNYAITQGSLDNPNYTITFETANFSITPKEITVTADEITKSQGSVDPELTYTIASGELETGDAFSGSLERETGETIGNYVIEIGTLSLTDNYTITFIEADFIITATASIDDIIISNQIQLYPNPVSSFLNIETNNQLEIKEVYIYNILGSLVKEVNTIEESISLDELSTGSYMMKIITDKGISVKRIIKK